MRDVAAHGKRLQVNLRTHDRGPEAEQDPAVHLLHGAGEDEEIAIAAVAERRPVAVRMLMQDVVTDADMNGGWHVQAPGSGEHAEMTTRKAAFFNAAADV